MKSRFVCLANSFKEGGRCIAGIELDLHNEPVFLNGKAKWIRPVHDVEHGQIPNNVAEPFETLDIIELEIIAHKPDGYQSENVTFDFESIRVIGNFNRENLNNLCEKAEMIFGNRGKAVAEDAIVNLNHSLMLVNISEFEIFQKVYDDNPDRPQIRLIFTFKNIRYNLPITDPSFLHKYHLNNELLTNIPRIYLTISLGIELKGWCYKLVAGVIY